VVHILKKQRTAKKTVLFFNVHVQSVQLLREIAVTRLVNRWVLFVLYTTNFSKRVSDITRFQRPLWRCQAGRRI